jgi:hypothetical protein
MAEMVSAKLAFGAGFTDHDSLMFPGSEQVCVACVWLLGSKPPMTLRTWSVLWRSDWAAAPEGNAKAQYPVGPKTICTSKNDMSAIREVLLDPPDAEWVCSVAETGHVHTAPFAAVNRGWRWTVRFEREDVTSDPHEFATVAYHAMSLLVGGFIRDDVETLSPHPSKLAKHGIALWREHAEPLRKYRKSALLAMILMIAKREEYDAFRRAADDTRKRPRAGHDVQRIDGRYFAHAVVGAREVGAGDGGGPRPDMGRAGGNDGEKVAGANAPQRYRQLSLFDGP